MKSSEIIRVIPYLLLTLMLMLSSCNVRQADRAKSQSSTRLAEDISVQTRTDASFQGKRVVLMGDSANHEYQVRIFPLDTFSFSVERGFNGKAASIEFAGTKKQVKASLESTVLSGENLKEIEGKIIRETKADEIAKAKSTHTSRISWWLIVAGALTSVCLIWSLWRLKQVI